MNDLTIILGLGKSGLSCIKYCYERGIKNIVAMDSRENPPELKILQDTYPNIPLFLGKFNEEAIAKAKTIIISPGIAKNTPAIANNMRKDAELIGDIELFVRAAKAPIIAITGSNGKSTVTTLVGEMADACGVRVQVGGNLGIPALDLLDDKAELYVLELSSFQLETTYSLKAKAAVVLNISPDHLDRYDGMQGYIDAKMRIYRNCENVILNRDTDFYQAYLATYPELAKPFATFGLEVPTTNNFGIIDKYLAFGNEKLLPINALKIKGMHQVANALASLALGYAAGLPFAPMLKALQEFPGLEHRCQWVNCINEVDWYNDSKGTNVGATEAAIEGLGKSITGKVVLIAGGQGKGADFTVLRNVVKNYVRTLILIGEDAKKIADALKDTANIKMASSLAEAVKIAKMEAKPQDVVLLSPACASFDMFKNFEHRGECFVKLVNDEAAAKS
jgi:UDP-N-acetylmuramoylalanine--D-glutamate ligase